MSKGVWVFGPLLVLLLVGISVLAVVYVNNRKTADRVLGEQNAKIATLTDKIDDGAKEITTKEQQIRDADKKTKDLADKNDWYAACKASVTAFYNASVAKDVAGSQAALTAIVRDCKVVV